MFKNKEINNESMVTLLFGRLVFNKEGNQLEKKEEMIKERKDWLLQIINFRKNINNLLEKGELKRYSDEAIWKFGGIKGNENYIYGKLAKKKSCDEMIEDNEKEDFCMQSIEKSSTSFFIIDLEKNIIAYESKKDLGEKAPIMIISESFNTHFKGKVNLEINTITNKKEIIKRMKSFSNVKKIILNIFPTNPNSTSNSKKMDEVLQKENIKKLLLSAQFGDKGYDLDKSDFVKSGLYLAQEGYGNVKVSGEIENETIVKEETKKKKPLIETISFGDIPIKSSIELDYKGDDEKNIEKLLEEIVNILRRLEENTND